MAAIWVPLTGALADAVENGLFLTMLLNGANQTLLGIAAMASSIKTVALLIGLLLLLGAVMAKFQERRSGKRF